MTRNVMLNFFQNITGANFNKSAKKRLKNENMLDETKQYGDEDSSPNMNKSKDTGDSLLQKSRWDAHSLSTFAYV